MKHGKICVTGFLVILIISSCSLRKNKGIDCHLLEVQKINSSIPTNNWEICLEYEGETMHRYELERNEVDKTNYLYFSYFPKGNCYDIDGYVVTFHKDSIYHEVSILNADTLYHFTAITELELINEKPQKKIEKNFLKGKKYYVKKFRIPLDSLDEPVY